MKNNYMSRIALAAGALVLTSGAAMAGWQNINSKIAAPSFVKGWSGNFTQVAEGIGENYNGAFEAYQVINDAPAGKYTLTANAFYRYANNELSQANMKDGANHNAYLFLGTAKKEVKGLFDEEGTAPNSLSEAKVAFEGGKYANTVEFDHPGGNLILGIGNTGGLIDEWCAFDNFKLAGPNGDVAIVNGDFADETLATDNGWDFNNKAGSAKLPDTPLCFVQTNPDKQGEYNGKVTGVFRKSNASEYNFGTSVELEAGKYRFGVQSFFRYQSGNTSGSYVTIKGGWSKVEGKSGYDAWNDKLENPDNMAYVYATDKTAEGAKPWSKTDEEAKGTFFNATTIKSIFAETLSVYPDNEPAVETPDATLPGWCDSGYEQEAAKCFINNPTLYRNYVEFELPAKATVWVGLGIDTRPLIDGNKTEYWNPARDFTLETWKEESGINNVAFDENAPVEYYNLQGVRVANPNNGIYIVKQGTKTTKVFVK